MLGIPLAAYQDFELRVFVASDVKITKEERIRRFVSEKVGLLTKSEIIQSCPDIVATAVEKVLGEIKRKDIVKTVDGSRGTKWCKA